MCRCAFPLSESEPMHTGSFFSSSFFHFVNKMNCVLMGSMEIAKFAFRKLVQYCKLHIATRGIVLWFCCCYWNQTLSIERGWMVLMRGEWMGFTSNSKSKMECNLAVRLYTVAKGEHPHSHREMSKENEEENNRKTIQRKNNAFPCHTCCCISRIGVKPADLTSSY